MRDIIVTTPKSEMANAAKEAADCIAGGGGNYFRSIRSKPTDFGPGQRVFYVEDGYIRGFAVCSEVRDEGGPMTCDSTGRLWGPSIFVIMPADSWKWIRPILYKGFQGWRYYKPPDHLEIVGDWKSPRPKN